MIITTEAVMATKPCPDYPEDRVRELVGDGLDPLAETTLELVLELPPDDARLVLSRLLTPANAAAWARASADRAQDHANYAASDADAAHYAADAAKCAAATSTANAADAAAAANYATARYGSAAAGAAHYAADAAKCAADAAAHYAAAEHLLAFTHALELIAGQKRRGCEVR